MMKMNARRNDQVRSLSFLTLVALLASFCVYAEDEFDAAAALVKAGKFLEAAVVYEKLAKDEPDNEDIWKEIGRCYASADEHTRALAAFGKAAAITPDDHTVHISMARCYDALGDRKTAVESYGKAAQAFEKKIAAETDGAKRKVLYKDIGNVYFDMEQYTKAEAAWNEAVKIDPSYGHVYNCLSAIYMKNKKYASAISVLATAYDLEPANTKPLLNLALVYAYLKDTQKCEAYAAKALAAKTPYPHYVYLYRAVLYANTGDKKGWMEQLTLALSTDKAKPVLDYRDDIATEHGFDPIRADADFIKLLKGRFGAVVQ